MGLGNVARQTPNFLRKGGLPKQLTPLNTIAGSASVRQPTLIMGLGRILNYYVVDSRKYEFDTHKLIDFARTQKELTPRQFDLHLELSELQRSRWGQEESSEPMTLLKSVLDKYIETDPVYSEVSKKVPTSKDIDGAKQEVQTTPFDDHCAIRLPNQTTALSVIDQLIASGTYEYPGIYPSNDQTMGRLPITPIHILGADQQSTFLISSHENSPVKRIFISWLDKDGPNMAPTLKQGLPDDMMADSKEEENYLIPSKQLSQEHQTVLAPNHFAINAKDLGFSNIEDYCQFLLKSSETLVMNEKTRLNVDDVDLNQRALNASDPKKGLYLEIVLRHSFCKHTYCPTIGFASLDTIASIGSSSSATDAKSS